jgi:hypothetical protein
MGNWKPPHQTRRLVKPVEYTFGGMILNALGGRKQPCTFGGSALAIEITVFVADNLKGAVGELGRDCGVAGAAVNAEVIKGGERGGAVAAR